MIYAIVTESGVDADKRGKDVAIALARLCPALVRFRDVALSDELAIEAARSLLLVCRAGEAPLFVPARFADAVPGTHCHFRDEPAALDQMAALRAAGDARLISGSAHDPAQAMRLAAIADYVYLGPIYPTTDKPRGLGELALREARASWPPSGALLLAIGGITTRDRVATAASLGADGVAGIRAFNGGGSTDIWPPKLEEKLDST